MNKTKKALLDDCREHLIFAIGSAAGAGEHETAARINAILVDIDIALEMCYTGKNAREARKTEGKKMKKYIFPNIYDDVCNWTQTAEELAAWTVPQMLAELKEMERSGDLADNEAQNGLTLEELAEAYTEAAHKLAAELMEE